MKLKLFNYVDELLKLHDKNQDEFKKIDRELTRFFNDLLKDDERILNITSRIKSQQSLREKVLRKNYFLEYSIPEEGFYSIPDLIGMRIECRFIKEEEQIYEKIAQEFRIYCGKGYYCSKKNQKIELNLDTDQPQILKNGFKIFKLSGIYRSEESFNFELQIKSLVNVFWGEIDHKILYKNYNYMITEDFFRDIMNAIIDNLSMVDRQLMILYDHVTSLDASAKISAENQLKGLLSKIIHDVFVNKVYDELGFVFDLNNTTDIIVDYLFMKCNKNKDLSYGENFISLINRINKISEVEMNLEDYIVFEENPTFYDRFTREIGNTLVKFINKDFEWNIFFKIIYQINEGSYEENFEDFLYFIRCEYTLLILDMFNGRDFSESDKIEFEEYILNEIIDRFKKDPSLNMILNFGLKRCKNALKYIEEKELADLFEAKYYFQKKFRED